MNKKWSGLVVVVGAMLMGFYSASKRWDMPSGPARALEQAEEYEILSLHPMLSDGEFHFHQVIGRVKISDPAVRKQLTNALKKSARESKGRSKAVDKPRHGIRVKSKGETVDLRIDFEGGEVKVYRNDEPEKGFAVSNSAQVVFNDLLTKAGVKVVGQFDSEEAMYQFSKGGKVKTVFVE